MLTVAVLMPLPVVPATFHIAVRVSPPDQVTFVFGEVTANALPVLTTLIVTSCDATPPPPERLSRTSTRQLKLGRLTLGSFSPIAKVLLSRLLNRGTVRLGS